MNPDSVLTSLGPLSRRDLLDGSYFRRRISFTPFLPTSYHLTYGEQLVSFLFVYPDTIDRFRDAGSSPPSSSSSQVRLEIAPPGEDHHSNTRRQSSGRQSFFFHPYIPENCKRSPCPVSIFTADKNLHSLHFISIPSARIPWLSFAQSSHWASPSTAPRWKPSSSMAKTRRCHHQHHVTIHNRSTPPHSAPSPAP